MMRLIHFENLEFNIVEAINSAQSRLFVAVAWITNKSILDALVMKIIRNLDVKIIVMDDDFNRSLFENHPKFLIGKNLFFRDSHHKYCIFDDNLVISGSFNWTHRASKREQGENITYFKNPNDIDFFLENFNFILGLNNNLNKSVSELFAQNLNSVSYGESVNRMDYDWWFSLNNNWKKIFIISIASDLLEICDDQNREIFMGLSRGQKSAFIDIQIIERLSIHPLITLVKYITNIINIKPDGENPLEINCLMKLQNLKSIKSLEVKSFMDLNKLKPLRITTLKIQDFFDLRLLNLEKFNNIEYLELKLNNIPEAINNYIPESVKELTINSTKDLPSISLYKLISFKNLEIVNITNCTIYNFRCSNYSFKIKLFSCSYDDSYGEFESLENLEMVNCRKIIF